MVDVRETSWFSRKSRPDLAVGKCRIVGFSTFRTSSGSCLSTFSNFSEIVDALIAQACVFCLHYLQFEFCWLFLSQIRRVRFL